MRAWLLAPLHERLNTIMATQQELAATLTALAAQVTKTREETLKRVAELEAALAADGGTSAEVDAALLALKGTVQASDDVVADPT